MTAPALVLILLVLAIVAMATMLANQMPPFAGPVQQQALPEGWRAEYEHSSGRWYVVSPREPSFFPTERIRECSPDQADF